MPEELLIIRKDDMEHVIRIRNKFITIIKNRDIVAQNVGTDTLLIDFDDEWLDMDTIYVVFTDTIRTRKTIYTGDPIEIPWECIFNPGYLYVVIIGYIGDNRQAITKIMGHPFRVRKSGDMNGSERPNDYPNLDYYNEIVTIVTEKVLEELKGQITGGVSVGDGLFIDDLGRLSVDFISDETFINLLTVEESDDAISEVALYESTELQSSSISIGDGLFIDDLGRLSVSFIDDENFMSLVVN